MPPDPPALRTLQEMKPRLPGRGFSYAWRTAFNIAELPELREVAIPGVKHWQPWRWPLLQRIIFVAMSSFFEFALMLVIPGALLILFAALLLTRST